MSNRSRNLRPAAVAIAFLLADFAAGALTAALSIALFHRLSQAAVSGQADAYAFLFIGLFSVTIGYFVQQGHYSLKAAWWQKVVHFICACLACFFVSGLVVYAWHTPGIQLINAVSWLTLCLSFIVFRSLARRLLIAGGYWSLPTSLVGGPDNVAKVLSALRGESYLHYAINRVVLLTATPEELERFREKYGDVDVQSSLPDAGQGDCVFFCPDDLNAERHEKIAALLAASGARLSYVPPIDEYFLYNARLQRFFGYGFVALESARCRTSQGDYFLKALLDKVGAATALLVFSPVFLGLAWVIRRDGGPAFYGHTRIGKGGRPFKCWKFRSMVTNSQEVLRDLLARDPAARAEYERDFKLKNDPRVTKIGALLRKTSLDEIPQLFNVLRGEMSLMGPRPIVEAERKYYEENINDYVSVKPGMTGLWQVSGRSDTGYDRRVYLDSWYVKNWSLWNDIIIVFKTVLVVLKRQGAY